MAEIAYPWFVFSPGDWYLRSIIVNGAGIETVKVYTGTGLGDDPETPAVTKTFSPPFSGKRINFDLRTPFVKIRVVFEGASVSVLDMFYNVVEKRIA